MPTQQPQYPAAINPKFGSIDWVFTGAYGAKNLGSRNTDSVIDGTAYSRKAASMGLANYLGMPGTNTSKILLSSTPVGDFSTNWGVIVFSVPTGGAEQGLFHSYFKMGTNGDGGFYIKVNGSNRIEIDKANVVALLFSSNTVKTGHSLNVVVWSFTDTSATVVLNGVVTSTTFSSASVLNDLAGFGTNQLANEAVSHDQLLSAVTTGRILSTAQMLELCANPWALFLDPRRALRKLSVSSSTQNLAASGGAVAGGNAQLKATVSIAAIGLSVASGNASAKETVSLAAVGLSQASGSAGANETVSVAASGLSQASGIAGGGIVVSLAASGLAQALGSALASLQAKLAASGGGVAGGSAALASGNMTDLAAVGQAVAGGNATIKASISLNASGSGVAGGSASPKVDVELSAQALAQAAGTGVLHIEIPLSAFGGAFAGGLATLQLVDNDVFVLGAPRRVQISGPEPRRPVQRFSSRPGQYNTRTRH